MSASQLGWLETAERVLSKEELRDLCFQWLVGALEGVSGAVIIHGLLERQTKNEELARRIP